MKKLVNDPRRVVREMLEGQVDLCPGQALLDEPGDHHPVTPGLARANSVEQPGDHDRQL